MRNSLDWYRFLAIFLLVAYIQNAIARISSAYPIFRFKRQEQLSGTAYEGQDTPFTQGAQPYNPYLYQSVPAGSSCANGLCVTGNQYQYNPPPQYQTPLNGGQITYADQTNNLDYVDGRLQREPENNPNNFLYTLNHPTANCNTC